MSADDEIATRLDQLVDAADPDSGYMAPACPFPAPHGLLGQTNLPRTSGFQVVCHTHLDHALLTIAAPTPTGGQAQPRCSGCMAGPTIPGANPFGVIACWPTLQTFTLAEASHVRACEQHLLAALTGLLETL